MLDTRYYVAIVQNGNTQALFAYDNIDTALEKFHSEMGYHESTRNSTLCLLFDQTGYVMRNELWERYEEPEVIEEEGDEE